MENQIKVYMSQSNWDSLMKKIDPQKLASALSYEEGMNAARDIFNWNYRSDNVINYAIDLLFAINKQYEEKWNKDIKNALYVSELCEMTLRYQECFDSIKRAYELSRPNPSALILFSFANTYFLPPEVDTISQEEAIKLFKESIEKECTYEAARLLRNIYGYQNDTNNYDYWDTVAKEAQIKNLHVPIIVPDVFRRKTENEPS